MEQVNPVYNYTIAQEGEYSAITYHKKTVSSRILFPLCIYMLLPAVFITAAFQPSSVGGGVFIFGIFDFGVAWLIRYLINAKRKTATIKVNRKSIVVADKTYQIDHVANFTIKDRKGGELNHTVYSSSGYYPNTLSGGVQNISNSMKGVSQSLGNAMKTELNASGFRIVMRYASKEITVADHLGEFEAEALFDKITEIAGFTAKA